MRSMRVEQNGETLAVIFIDRNISDELRIMEIGDELTKLAREMSAGGVLALDFQGVEYISSAMVGQMVQLRNATESYSVELRLRHLSPTIQAILHAMHLDKTFRIENSDAA